MTSALTRLLACDIEVLIHRVIFTAGLLPLYAIALHIYFIQQGIESAYCLTRRCLITFAGISIRQIEQVRFEGNELRNAAVMTGLVIIVVAFIRYWREMEIRTSSASGVVRRWHGERNLREIPAALARELQDDVFLLSGPAAGLSPRLYCFAATSILACVFSDGGRPALAVSTGLLQRRFHGRDPLLEIILRHEIAHLQRGDEVRLARAAAIASVCYSTMLWLIGVFAAVRVSWAVFEKADIGQLGPSDASAGAYVKSIIVPAALAYCGLIILVRYLSLIIMLTELRADVYAARAGVTGIEASITSSGARLGARDTDIKIIERHSQVTSASKLSVRL